MTNILIISNDPVATNFISHIIEENDLGRVSFNSPKNAGISDEIIYSNPAVIIIDYILPYCRCSHIIKKALENSYNGRFIVLTDEYTDDVLEDSYSSGAFFVIRKPVNYYEVLSILNYLMTYHQLEQSVLKINGIIENIDRVDIREPIPYIENNHDKIINIFSDIGIIGELAVDDLLVLIDNVMKYKEKFNNNQYLLQDMYKQIARKQSSKKSSKISPNTIEQRIRRAIQKSLSNIAEIGVDDYGNPIFSEYSTTLFDFQQVRQEMNYIKGRSNIPGKINIKKFIEGVISKIEV